MGQTSNYGLNQWVKPDLIQMEDFNSDNEKIDAALKTNADAVAAVTAIAGNCEMELVTWTGTGSYGSSNPTTIKFTQQPDIFVVVGDVSLIVGKWGNKAPVLCSRSGSSGGFVSEAAATFSGSTLKLTNGVDARYQCNSSGAAYWAMGLWIKK